MNVNMNRVATVSLPSGMYTQEGAANFIDGIALPASSDFRSAALVSGPQNFSQNLGVLAYNKKTGQYEFTAIPHNFGEGPETPEVLAACGISGGLVAFAMRGQGELIVQIRNTVVSDGTWNLVHEFRFGALGSAAIQCMLERNGKIYGFMKGGKNYFMTIDLLGGTAKSTSYAGTAAAAYFPRPSQSGYNQFMLRTIGFYDDKIYAIDETYANVLCASPDGSVATLPLAKPHTWGLVIDQNRGKAYGTYTTTSDFGEYILPYTIDPNALTRGTDTIDSLYPLCPSVDAKLGLLYMPSGLSEFQVIRTDQDTAITVTGQNAPTLTNNFLEVDVGSWADADNGIFYASGRVPTGQPSNVDEVPSHILVYEVSVTNN